MLDAENIATLPGSELVLAGLRDLSMGRETINAAAVAMAAPRLRESGIPVTEVSWDEPAAHLLYRLLAQEDFRAAHSRYNAIGRRVLSFARAAERSRAAAEDA